MNFPEKGLSFDEIQGRLKEYERISHMVEPYISKNLGGDYHLYGLPGVQRVAKAALVRFMDSNTANPGEDGVHEMARSVLSMIASIWGSDRARGFLSAGGTESNLTAMMAARNLAKGKKGNVIIPDTAHPSFARACYLLGLNPVSVPAEADFVADVDAMANAVNKDTIAIVGTAGTWPFATVDPIKKIGKIAEEKSLYFHVDAAMAGFLCPWLKMAGYDIPDFDFRVKGVTSMASDPHKLGYTTYPAGCLMLKDEEHLKLASWSHSSTTHASYSSFGILGSRPGHAVAVAYSVFNYLGREGFTKLAKKNMKITQNIVDAAQEIPGISVANPHPMVNLAMMYSNTVDLGPVKEKLAKKGWVFHTNNGQPKTVKNSIVLWLYPYAEKIWPPFLEDLRKAVAQAG